MLPSLENLRCFVETARHLNFRAAARAVSLSPGALGQRVRQLEEQMGELLFVRSTRHVRLTRAGVDLLPYAENAISAATRCIGAARGEVAHAPTELVVGTRHELGMSLLLPLLPALAEVRAGLTIHLYFGSSTDLLVRVRSLDIDCALGSMRVTDARLDALPLQKEEYVFVGQPALLAREPLRRSVHARRHTLIDTHADLPLFSYWRDAPRGGDRLEFARILRLGTIAAIRYGILRGHGVAVLPRYFVEKDVAAGKLAIVFPSVKPMHDHFKLVFRRDDSRRQLYEELARHLRKERLE
jgi:DNA-binding transcriptional LysR family regulator